MWHVVVDGRLYVRSVRGVEGTWYKGVIHHYEGAISWDGRTRDVAYSPDATGDDQIDAAYFAKYGNGGNGSVFNCTLRSGTRGGTTARRSRCALGNCPHPD